MALVRLNSVSFVYGSKSENLQGNISVNALKNINLSLEKGDYLAIAGSNGSGKSTLLRLIAGLLEPDSGSIRFDDSGGPPAPENRKFRVGLVFQSPSDQIVSSVVEDDVAFGCENLGLMPDEIGRRIESSLAAVGLLDERHKPTRFLSAGQQQRLAIAGALAMRPVCMAFDEATAMLDPDARDEVLNILDRLVADEIAVIHVTHDMREASRASRLAVLDSGELVYDGKPTDFFASRDPDLYGLEFPPEVRIASALGLEANPGESAEVLGQRIRKAGVLTKAPIPASRSARRDDRPSRFPKSRFAPNAEPAFNMAEVSFSWLKGTLNQKLAVDEVDFSVPRGSFVALVGRTGSGKSSVLQLLNALNRPDSGTVVSLGIDTSTGKPAEKSDGKTDGKSAGKSGGKPVGESGAKPAWKRPRDAICGLFRKKGKAHAEDSIRRLRLRAPMAIQRPESALFEFHAGDDVAFGPRNLGLAGKELVARVSAWMETFGLPFLRFRDRPTRSLSGGEKRRLALAGVFAMESEAVLLDEPGSALDPVTRRSVMTMLAGYARLVGGREPEGRDAGKSADGWTGRTLVMITHSMEEAAAADLVGVFSEGRLVAFDTPDMVFGRSYDSSWGIARPFAAQVALHAGIEDPNGKLPLDVAGLVSASAEGGFDAGS